MARVHLYNADNIKELATIRPFGINEYTKLLPYVYEAESEWLIPVLTPAFFSALCADTSAYTELLEGGNYKEDTCFFEGLKTSVAYLAYSRFIRNKNAIVTASGVVIKDMPYSASESDENILRMANESEKIGLKYLRHVRAYCIFKDYITESKTECKRQKENQDTTRKRNLKIIGE